MIEAGRSVGEKGQKILCKTEKKRVEETGMNVVTEMVGEQGDEREKASLT